MPIRLKRAYDPPGPSDGLRILVERLWPRGLSKERAAVDDWAKEIAPSPELRRWYSHDSEKWSEFQRRYESELDERPDEVAAFAKRIRGKRVTFVFGSKEETRNSAAVLKRYMDAR